MNVNRLKRVIFLEGQAMQSAPTSGKEPHCQVGVSRVIASGSLGSVMARMLAAKFCFGVHTKLNLNLHFRMKSSFIVYIFESSHWNVFRVIIIFPGKRQLVTAVCSHTGALDHHISRQGREHYQRLQHIPYFDSRLTRLEHYLVMVAE